MVPQGCFLVYLTTFAKHNLVYKHTFGGPKRMLIASFYCSTYYYLIKKYIL